jgi:hypothetical protein
MKWGHQQKPSLNLRHIIPTLEKYTLNLGHVYPKSVVRATSL